MSYQIALGHDNAVHLTPVTPAPACPLGLRPARRLLSADGHLVEAGALLADWVYSGALDATTYANLLAQFGLSSAPSAAVTVHTPDLTRTFVTHNAIVHRPAPRYEHGAYRDVVFHFVVV